VASAITCPACGTEHTDDDLRARQYVCPACGHYLHMPARERIASLADPRSFRERSGRLVSVDPLRFTDQRTYRDRLAEAQRRTGLREAALTGTARIEGRVVMLIVLDFAFMGGTMGSVVGEKIADAFEQAARRRLPVVSVVASGGARMQEGMLSLMQMAKTAAARAAHHRAGLVYISVLSDPTFGGVAASFASLGDVIIAEPGAQIGFVGPRVIEMTLGERLPADSHRAETLLHTGMIDLITPRPDLRATVAYLLGYLRASGSAHWRRVQRRPARQAAPSAAVESWQEVQLARQASRPTALDYIGRLFSKFVELHGDRLYGDDAAIICGLGEFDDSPVVIVAQERGRTDQEREVRRRGMALPEGYRKALRVMELAAKFRLPVITLIDTPGAHPGAEAERRGIAQAIARNLQSMAALPTPVISVIIGEGGSGGALGLAVADVVLMLEHAIYSVIAPEGAAAILWRDAGRAEEVANALKITAADLRRLGVIDDVVPEPPGGAHLDPDLSAWHLRQALGAALRTVLMLRPAALLRRRYEKFRHIGRVGVYWREVVRSEMQELLEAVERRMPRRERGAEAVLDKPDTAT
jgi:acetyl-CoA carboxylase carboxyl transferase alpha subunit/acetyl-CoA carboxylase carboxyl transferase beta subunit